MPKIRFDFLVMETFDRILGTTAFMETADKPIPDAESQEREALKQLADEQHWDFGDYYVEQQILDEKFGHWVPTLAAYSLVIILHSTLETQLDGLAERVGQIRSSGFTLRDITGSEADDPARRPSRHAISPRHGRLRSEASEDFKGAARLDLASRPVKKRALSKEPLDRFRGLSRKAELP